MNRKLRYLVKWEGFGVEHNSWEPWDNLHAPERVTDFYRKHPGAARHIRAVDFNSIPFHSYSPSVVSGRHYLEGGVDVRGQSISRLSSDFSDISDLHTDTSLNTPRYVPPHHRPPPNFVQVHLQLSSGRPHLRLDDHFTFQLVSLYSYSFPFSLVVISPYPSPISAFSSTLVIRTYILYFLISHITPSYYLISFHLLFYYFIISVNSIFST